MLIPPRYFPSPCLQRRGMPTIFSAPGEISTGEVGKFQPAKTGEYSTGVDTDDRGSRPLTVFTLEIRERIVIQCAFLFRPIEETGNQPGAVCHEMKRSHLDSIMEPQAYRFS